MAKLKISFGMVVELDADVWAESEGIDPKDVARIKADVIEFMTTELFGLSRMLTDSDAQVVKTWQH